MASLMQNDANVIITPESQFKFKLISKDWSRDEVISYLEQDFRFRLWNVDTNSIFIDNEQKNYHGVEVLELILNAYCRKHNITGSIWVDHTPENTFHIDTLNSKLPNSQFIHLIRDSRAVYNSIKKLDWGNGNIFDITCKWVTSNGIIASYQTINNVKFYTIKYEDLLVNSDNVLNELYNEYLKVEFDSRFESNSNRLYWLPNYTQKQHSLVGKKPNIKKINEWQMHLTLREIQIVDAISGQLLKIYGYKVIEHKKLNSFQWGLLKVKFDIISIFFHLPRNKFFNHLRRKI